MPVFSLYVPLNLFLGEPREVDGRRHVRFDLAGKNVHLVEEHGSLRRRQRLKV